MLEKLILKEDDRTRDESFRQSLPATKLAIRTTLVATPILVGCMYLLMRNLPKEAFPKNFWAFALFLPIFSVMAMMGVVFLQARYLHRKFVLSAAGVRSDAPSRRFIPWRKLSRWQIEDSWEHPGYFSVEFYGQNPRSTLKIILPNTYSKENIRNYVMHSIAQAY